MGEDPSCAEEQPEDRVRDDQRRQECGDRLADQEFFAPDRRGQDRFQRALLPLPDDRVRGQCGRDDLCKVGATMKMSGTTDIVTTMNRLRR
jgi:hypothetical protein